MLDALFLNEVQIVVKLYETLSLQTNLSKMTWNVLLADLTELPYHFGIVIGDGIGV
jgi:hypothetical protein